MDGARVAAAAVTWLSQQPRSSTSVSQGAAEGPAALLRHLRGEVAQTEDMREKLDRLAAALFEVGISAWQLKDALLTIPKLDAASTHILPGC